MQLLSEVVHHHPNCIYTPSVDADGNELKLLLILIGKNDHTSP